MPGTTSGPESDSVTLNLNVTPVADDAIIPAADGDEDSAIAFLAGFAVTDTSTRTDLGGQELVRSVSFDVPTGWTVTTPSSIDVSVTTDGTTVTIVNTTGNTSTFETYLDTVTITPPAHDSSDVPIQVTVRSVDRASIDGNLETDERSTDYVADRYQSIYTKEPTETSALFVCKITCRFSSQAWLY